MLAWIVDYVVLNVLVLLVGLLLQIVVEAVLGQALIPAKSGGQTVFLLVVAQLVTLAYYTFCWSFEGGGQTIGNRFLGVRVTKSDGDSASRLRALARAALMYLSIYALFLGVAISIVTILVTPRRQALHDLICDTVMVRASG